MTFTPVVRNIVDSNNSSTTPLVADATFTGTEIEVVQYNSIRVHIASDVDSAVNGVIIGFGTQSGTTDVVQYLATYNVSQGVFVKEYPVKGRYFQISYTNGSTGQTGFDLQVVLQEPVVNPTVIKPARNITDAFGRMRVSNPETLFSSTHVEGPNDYAEASDTTGTGSVSRNSNTVMMELSVTTNGDEAIRQSRRYIVYQPGKSMLVMMTGVINANTNASTVTSRIGLFDASNGAFFEYNNGFSVNIRSSISGSTVLDTTDQADWNIDPMDGSGPSGITLDSTKTQIYSIDYQWLGVGVVRFAVNIDGTIYYVHESYHANSLTVPYSQRGSLPVRFEISSTGGAGRLDYNCASVMSEGGFQELGTPFGTGTTTGLSVGATEVPLVTIRLKSANRRVNVQPTSFTVVIAGTNTLAVRTRLFRSPSANPLNAGTTTFTSASPNSFVEYNVIATGIDLATDSSDVVSFDLVTANKGSSTTIGTDRTNLFILSDIAGDPDYFVVTAINLTGGTETVYGSLGWVEIY